MKSQIFGRKVGSGAEMKLLISGEGATSGGRPADPRRLHEVEIANTRRAVSMLRGKGIEGYVLFENDPARYQFTPDEDELGKRLTPKEKLDDGLSSRGTQRTEDTLRRLAACLHSIADEAEKAGPVGIEMPYQSATEY